MSSGVKVRGTCKAGHITEATAQPGRVTWQGKCADNSCDLQVNARRIPKDQIPSGESAVNADDPYRVIKVDSYGDTGHPAGDGITVESTTPADAGSDGSGTEGSDAAGGDPIDAEHEPGRASKLRERLRPRRTVGVAGPGSGGHSDYRHPLGIG